MRLIDADLIIELLEKEKARDDCRGGWYSTVCSIIRLLKAAPTVTLGEVFKDEEVHKPDYSYESDLMKRIDCAWKEPVE